jgi:hypothetical protein
MKLVWNKKYLIKGYGENLIVEYKGFFANGFLMFVCDNGRPILKTPKDVLRPYPLEVPNTVLYKKLYQNYRCEEHNSMLLVYNSEKSKDFVAGESE